MLKSMYRWTPQTLQSWENTRRRGKRHFIWWLGVVKFGGLTFLLSMLVKHFTIEAISWRIILIDLVVWSVAGYVYGTLLWSGTERSYLKYLMRQQNKNTQALRTEE